MTVFLVCPVYMFTSNICEGVQTEIFYLKLPEYFKVGKEIQKH